METKPAIAMVVFDMFGTLAHNGVDQWKAAFVEIVRQHGWNISPDDLHREWTTREVSFRTTRTRMDDPQASPPFRTYEEVWAEAFTGAFEAMSVQGDAAAAARRCIQDLGVRQPLEEDTTATLKHLATDWPLAVLSNADDNFLLPVIAHNGWSFNTVVSSESARVYKPDPRIFAAFCEEASVLPEQVLYVGDSPYDDIHGAKLAGMHAVLIRSANPTPGRTPPPDGQELLKADFEIGSLREMEPLLTEHVTPAQSRR